MVWNTMNYRIIGRHSSGKSEYLQKKRVDPAKESLIYVFIQVQTDCQK